MNQGKGSAALNSDKHFIQEALVFCPECGENQFTTSMTLNYFYWFKLKYIMGKEWGKGHFNRTLLAGFKHFPAAQGNHVKNIEISFRCHCPGKH